ncbi:MAG: N-sulfoglucosamine sulfohydrolase [Rhodothermales bacterium]|jgi:N-sulfoglucosamine sulfohydrolase
MRGDPFESTNLAYSPDHADVVETYVRKLKGHQIRTWDPWFLKWKYD